MSAGIQERADQASIIVGLLGVVAILASLVWLVQTRTPATESIATLGAVASVVALVVALIQIFKIRSVSEETRNRVRANLSIAEVSRGIRFAEEVQSYIHNKEYQLAGLRLNDLRQIVVRAAESDTSREVSTEEEIQDLLQELGVGILSVRRVAADQRRSFDGDSFSQTVDAASELLIKLENKLTFDRL